MNNLFGLKYDLFSHEETLDFICNYIEKNGCKTMCRSDINVSTIVNSQHDDFIRQFINKSELVNIDGFGALLGCKLLGKKAPERVTGADLFESLLARCNENKYSVFFLGATEDVIHKVVEKTEKKFKNVNIVGYHNGYFGEDHKSIVDIISKSKPDILFVGMQSPQKEMFIDNWRDSLNTKILMGVGGTFDVYSGKVKRAPKWLQNLGFEWLYRLTQEPRRMWRRYAYSNSYFFYLLLKGIVKKYAKL